MNSHEMFEWQQEWMDYIEEKRMAQEKFIGGKKDDAAHAGMASHRRRLAESDDALNTFDMGEVWPELASAGTLYEDGLHPLLPLPDASDDEPWTTADEEDTIPFDDEDERKGAESA